MMHPMRALAKRHRAKAAVRRQRDGKRVAEKAPHEDRGNREWHEVPLDMHLFIPPGQRNPRGRDGRRL